MKATGHYPLRTTAEEIQRLRMQSRAMEPNADALLAQIEVRPGWGCVDLACGVGGITNLLSHRVGPSGRVVGLDCDADKLAAAREWARARGLTNIDFVEGDAYGTRLPRKSFDLVHVRFLLSLLGRDEELLGEMVALARPGGVVAVQEVDIGTLCCHPPHPAWDRLTGMMTALLERTGGDARAGRRMFALLHRAGLEDVRFRPFLVGFTRDDEMAAYLPRTAESLRESVVALGLISNAELDDAIAACARHLAEPDTVSTSYLVFQVWGRTSGTTLSVGSKAGT